MQVPVSHPISSASSLTLPSPSLSPRYHPPHRQTADRTTLSRLTSLLSSPNPSAVAHHMWVEQPEDEPTCVALAPNRREKRIRKALDGTGCRLWKG